MKQFLERVEESLCQDMAEGVWHVSVVAYVEAGLGTVDPLFMHSPVFQGFFSRRNRKGVTAWSRR